MVPLFAILITVRFHQFPENWRNGVDPCTIVDWYQVVAVSLAYRSDGLTNWLVMRPIKSRKHSTKKNYEIKIKLKQIKSEVHLFLSYLLTNLIRFEDRGFTAEPIKLSDWKNDLQFSGFLQFKETSWNGLTNRLVPDTHCSLISVQRGFGTKINVC